ncbi:MAG: hypothetical protein OCU24_00880 [Candidatus Methanospirare jalkutatii]|nr:hypothetical protein [Candidatus Methanospirare jalkutatii]
MSITQLATASEQQRQHVVAGTVAQFAHFFLVSSPLLFRRTF